MSDLTITFSTLTRIIAVHEAAHDREQKHPTLTGVCLNSAEGDTKLAINATDGMILVEEVYPVSKGRLNKERIIAKDSVDMLKNWIKSVDKATPKNKPPGEVDLVELDSGIVVSCADSPVGPITLRCVEGTYPSLTGAFIRKIDADAHLLPSRVGVSAEYLGRLGKLWGSRGNHAVIMDFRYRGLVFYPLNSGSSDGARRALIMPVVLPN